MRKEQIEQAVQEAFLKSGIDKESFRQGIEWADENPINYDGKAMFHVLHKGAAIGMREMLDKACEWLEHRQVIDLEVPNIEKFINDFRKAMEV